MEEKDKARVPSYLVYFSGHITATCQLGLRSYCHRDKDKGVDKKVRHTQGQRYMRSGDMGIGSLAKPCTKSGSCSN